MPMFEMAGYEPERAGDAERMLGNTALAWGQDEQTLSCFLVSARCGCFMQAARSLNLKATVLRKKLARLEARLGYPLFVHRGNALVLSRQGRQLQALLQSGLANHTEQAHAADAAARVRLAVPEPIVQDILGRNLVAFVRQNAGIRLEICAPTDEEVDVRVWLTDDQLQPAQSSAFTPSERLAVLEYLPHIAKRYCREVNRPVNLDDLQDYMLVQWQGDQDIKALAPWQQLLDEREAGVTTVPGYELFGQLIRCSACIGLLAHYSAQLDRGLLALPGLFAAPMQRGLWLAVSERTAQAPLVQVLVAMIRASFSERDEWF